ncbi:hypothetical protein HDU76_008426, partial [Blyttiomyces sp. JEL0837]
MNDTGGGCDSDDFLRDAEIQGVGAIVLYAVMLGLCGQCLVQISFVLKQNVFGYRAQLYVLIWLAFLISVVRVSWMYNDGDVSEHFDTMDISLDFLFIPCKIGAIYCSFLRMNAFCQAAHEKLRYALIGIVMA